MKCGVTTMSEERWKDAAGGFHAYEISNYGKLRTKRNGAIVAQLYSGMPKADAEILLIEDDGSWQPVDFWELFNANWWGE